jgi:hypothetical protein
MKKKWKKPELKILSIIKTTANNGFDNDALSQES